MRTTLEKAEIVYDQGGAIGRRLGARNTPEFVHLSLEPGSEIPEHQLPFDVAFFVQSGRPVASIDGHPTPCAAGDLIEVPANASRGWTNDSSEAAAVFVIKHIQ
ncbi:MAG: cupin domain-containing protein [Planctomycetota bacterium]|jgi:quercetin dioxygenase-like cupin family protein